MAAPPFSDEQLTQQLQLLRSQLNKKQTFESSLSSIKTLLLTTYPSSSLPIRTLFYDVVCRVATVLRTRYTFPVYLSAGIDLLENFNRLAVNSVEKIKVQSLIADLRQTLGQQEEGSNDGGGGGGGRRGGYLFEGHLTVDPEPPQPNWLVQQNLLTALAAQSGTTSAVTDGDDDDDDGNAGNLMRRLVESLEVSMMENIEEFLPAMEGAGGRAAPPASKEVVEKLRVIKLEDEGDLNKVGGDGAECCICKEKLGVGDEMQEMPCKHLFHPPCLKPWLDEHNSCPICRHELPTDDHKYESWKEREKELEEERRGAANAVRGGEFMYI